MNGESHQPVTQVSEVEVTVFICVSRQRWPPNLEPRLTRLIVIDNYSVVNQKVANNLSVFLRIRTTTLVVDCKRGSL